MAMPNGIDCCNNQTLLIPSRPCVHPSTFPKVLVDKFCSSKCRENIIIAHNYFRKTQTNQATCCLAFQ